MTQPHARSDAFHKYGLFVLTFLLFSTALPEQARAGEQSATASPQHAPQTYAKVWRLSGTVTATSSQPSVTRKLMPGDAVYVGERIQAQDDSEAVLQTNDNGYIALRPASAFSVKEFAANQQSTDRIFLHQFQGGLRLLTGWIGKLNPRGYRVFTPTAIIGIRGTDHEPYVVTDELAVALSQPAGTYDKVNTGGTVLAVSGGAVDVNPGKVGFARLAKPVKSRALITLLLPTILERVPNFYVPGRFDGELDRISASPGHAAAQAEVPDAAPQSGALATRQVPARLADGQCNADGVASAWLQRLDSALARKDSAGVLSLFAANASIRSLVVDAAGGHKQLDISREEFVSSTRAAMKGLEGYSQRRLSTTATPVNPDHCDTVSVQSMVVEQGRQNGVSFSFRTVEDYRLEIVDGFWKATRAVSTQQ